MTSTPEPEYDIVAIAAELLMAAITMRDVATGMHPEVFAEMPPDIRGRVTRPTYQMAFDGLPHDVQIAARALVDADPDIVEARRIDAEFRARRR